MPANPITCDTIALEPGETFVLYSDGVSEAMDAKDDLYGEERLLAMLAASRDAAPAEIVSRVLADVRAFVDGAKQSDDITILAARYA
jgi:sigma-B regulation protein RsbU (phosphoserine phosphatase)